MKTRGTLLTFAFRAARAFTFTAVWGMAVSSLATAAETGTPAKSPQPEVSISLRGTWDGQVEVGELLLVAVRIDAAGEGSGKITLAPARGSWIETTSVEILAAKGSGVVATAKPAVAASATEASVVLDEEQAAHGLWWFAGESTGSLAPGEYLVRAKLAIRDGTAWKGEIVSEPAVFTLVPTSNDPQRVTQRVLSRAQAAVLQDAPEKAAAILDEVLTRDPDNIAVLEMRAALCLSGGNPATAYVCVNRARSLAARADGHPSVQLHAFASQIEAVMMAENQTAPATAPEAWTSPPRSVFGAIRPAVSAADSKTPTPALSPASAPAKTPAIASAPGSVPTQAVTPANNAAPIAPTGAASPGKVVPAAELVDATIISDRFGQWAVSANAGSQYGRSQYSASQATGAPNISVAGNSPQAWCPAVRDQGMDWLEVTFAEPVEATEVRVRQNDASGAIVKVEAFEANGTAHVWWEGVDPYKPAGAREIVWFAVRVPKTDYDVARVKLTLNLASGPGYKEIDAVQLVAAP
jgi:hypothetical protein